MYKLCHTSTFYNILDYSEPNIFYYVPNISEKCKYYQIRLIAKKQSSIFLCFYTIVKNNPEITKLCSAYFIDCSFSEKGEMAFSEVSHYNTGNFTRKMRSKMFS